MKQNRVVDLIWIEFGMFMLYGLYADNTGHGFIAFVCILLGFFAFMSGFFGGGCLDSVVKDRPKPFKRNVVVYAGGVKYKLNKKSCGTLSYQHGNGWEFRCIEDGGTCIYTECCDEHFRVEINGEIVFDNRATSGTISVAYEEGDYL